MKDAIVSRPFVSLVVLLKDGIWEDTGIRLFKTTDIDLTYSVIEAGLLGTLTKKHYHFGVPTSSAVYNRDKMRMQYGMGVVSAYRQNSDKVWRRWYGLTTVRFGDGLRFTGLMADSRITFDYLHKSCMRSESQVTGRFDPVEE